MSKSTRIACGFMASSFALAAAGADSTAPKATAAPTGWQKPAWLTDLSLGVKEGYDDNYLGVSGDGLSKESSWVSTVSPKIGFNFAPLLGKQKAVTALSLTYAPDFVVYHNAPSQSYDAHRIGDSLKVKSGNFSFSLDNAFLYNDGNKQAPIYALNQLAGAAGNQNDKFRNNYAHGMARERLNQIQDRMAIVLQYDWAHVFFRPNASWLEYNLNTDQHTNAAPFKGYQNYPSRFDVNGGADLGYKVTKDVSVFAGYRYGHQYQQSFKHDIDPAAVNGQAMQSSSDYQRILFGLEGKPWKWLNVKLAGGPDFRDYNYAAPVNDRHPMTYYGEAAITATITKDQTLAFTYKQWQWESSSGKIPYFDSSFALAYHWNVTKQFGLDLGGKILESDYTVGNNITGSAGSVRDDREYEVSAGVSYAFTKNLSASLSYVYDRGVNVLGSLPASLAPDYRNFDHQLVSLGLQYKF